MKNNLKQKFEKKIQPARIERKELIFSKSNLLYRKNKIWFSFTISGFVNKPRNGIIEPIPTSWIIPVKRKTSTSKNICFRSLSRSK